MCKKISFSFILLILWCVAPALFAQDILFELPVEIEHPKTPTTRYRISLITIEPGNAVWNAFGHVSLRVIDNISKTDLVYEYIDYDYGRLGTDEDFVLRFLTGRLLLLQISTPYQDYLKVIQQTSQERVLAFTDPEAIAVLNHLKHDALPRGTFYAYDMLFQNCTTCLRDIFTDLFKPNLQFGNVLEKDKKSTYRDIVNQYLESKYWEKFCINLFLGSVGDKEVSNEEAMFVPEKFKRGIEGALLNGQKLTSEPVTIVSKAPKAQTTLNQPLILTSFLAILTFIGVVFRPFRLLGKVMSFLVLLLSGLIGFEILYLWFGANYPSGHQNYNLLWALPTNVIWAFWPKRAKSRYALVALILLMACLMVHFLGIQQLPLLELGPLLFALCCLYMATYRGKF